LRKSSLPISFNSFKIYKGLPKSIYILFSIKVINAMGNFVFPFLTLYLTKKMGMSEKAAGTFFTIAAISAAPGLIVGGRLADHIGRKKVFALFQAASVLCFLPCAIFSRNLIIPWLLILSAFFNGGAQPPLGAMINDLTNQNNRKQAFSLLYLGNNIGFAAGPLLAGFLFENYTSLLFVGNFITGIFAVIILLRFIKETIPDEVKGEEDEVIHINEKAESGSFLRILFKKPRLLIFALISIIYSFVYAQFPFCGSLEMRAAFSRGPELYGVLMTINGIVVITLTTPIIRLTRGIKPLLNVAIAGVFFGVGMGMLYFIHAFLLFIISTIIWTIGEILNATNAGVYIANNTPSSHRGRFNAIIPLITGSGFALGPLIMGRYINGRNVRIAWPLVFTIEMLAAVMIFILYIIDKRVEGKIR
jgi:MFS family permease